MRFAIKSTDETFSYVAILCQDKILALVRQLLAIHDNSIRREGYSVRFVDHFSAA
jgi:hypothetical protein